jgi:adenosylhomocysteine nucleosidase
LRRTEWNNSRILRERNFIYRTLVLVVLTFALLSAGRTAAIQQPERLIGIIGITSEVAPVEGRIQNAKVTRIQGVVFTSGTIEGTRVVAARSGAGKVNAAFAATLLVDHFSPGAVVFTGTAGAIGTDLNPGDVVIGTAVGYHDFGDITTTGFVRSRTRNAGSGQLDPLLFPADPVLFAAARRAAASVKLSVGPNDDGGVPPRVREGVIVTGDAFVASPASRETLRRELNATAVEMEGAAVAQVCTRFGVPTIIIRSITDHADNNAPGSYERYVAVAARNAAELTLATIREMAK